MSRPTGGAPAVMDERKTTPLLPSTPYSRVSSDQPTGGVDAKRLAKDIATRYE